MDIGGIFMTNNLVGIIDFDFLTTKKFCNYNFGVLLVSSYYLEQGIKPRLILNLSYDNLSKYTKIYIFKDYKTNILPINIIHNYYSLPIEEYGEGFCSRPLYPDLPNIIYTNIKTDIYKPIIRYMEQVESGFTIDKNWKRDYFPTKMFFSHQGELLVRDISNKRKILVYDDPLLFFTQSLGLEKMTELKKHSKIIFIKPLHITQVPAEYWKEIMNNPLFAQLKKNLYAYDSDEKWGLFYGWLKNNPTKGTIKIIVKTDKRIRTVWKKGGEISGDYRFEENDKSGIKYTASKQNISTWGKWNSTQRFNQADRRYRERDEDSSRRRYLPSETAKRRINARRIANEKRYGKRK